MSPIRALARPMLAAPFVLDGIARLRSPETSAAKLRPLLSRVSHSVPQLRSVADRPELLARVVGGVQIGAGALLAVGKASRLSSALIVATQGLSLATDISDTSEEAVGRRAAAIATRVGLTGGALLASVDTAGKPSLAWRAKDVGKRGSRKVKREVKREVKAAKKALD